MMGVCSCSLPLLWVLNRPGQLVVVFTVSDIFDLLNLGLDLDPHTLYFVSEHAYTLNLLMYFEKFLKATAYVILVYFLFKISKPHLTQKNLLCINTIQW